MDSESLLNGIKSVLTGLGAKTSNTTNGGVMLVNTQTGEPNGMMTMANLASVLGGLIEQETQSFNDTKLEALTETRASRFTGYSGSLLSGHGTYGVVISFKVSTYVFQLICFGQDHSLFYRLRLEDVWKTPNRISIT